MSLLFSNEIINAVFDELKYADDSVQIITAYCKKSTFEKLDSVISDDISKRLLVRFRMDDVIKGSTDFEILSYGIENGWDIYLRFDLHAKTYIVDNKRCLVGSANVTNSGLNIGKVGNMEMAAFVDVEPDDISKINGLFNDAILVDRSLIKEMGDQLQLVPKSSKKESYSWNAEITKRFNPHIETLFSYELPDENVLEVGTFYSFLDSVYTGDLKRFRETLRWSNAYMWLMDVLKDKECEMYFGELTEKLHNCLVTDPKPYRKDVKQMLSNLLDLIIAVEMEEIVIDRPRYSQRVRLIVEE